MNALLQTLFEDNFSKILLLITDLNIIFISPGRLSSRDKVTSGKVTKHQTKLFFLKKIRTLGVCVALKSIVMHVL